MTRESKRTFAFVLIVGAVAPKPIPAFPSGNGMLGPFGGHHHSLYNNQEGSMTNRRLATLGLVFTLLFLSLPAVTHAQSGCGLSVEFADTCDLAGGDGSNSGGGPRACRRCVIGDDGSVNCKDSSIYQAQWQEYYPCSVVTRCYYDGLQGWHCEIGCEGTLCYSV